MASDTAKAFSSLFKGRKDAHGTEQGGCIKEKVTLEHYEKHLLGEESLGVYPLLDDGTCNFFAVDIDEKDFNKAKSIRKELHNIFIPAYISASRRKGYHIYGFADEKFKAKEIRHILNSILTKLAIKAEIFPKQSEVSKQIPYGNYINLPCFGFTRPFLTTDLKEVPVDLALGKIKCTPQESIERALRSMPEVVEQALTPKRAPGRPRKGAPPCVEAMLKGVGAGARDEAAFALARHYFDFQYLPEEVLGLLVVWDTKNDPPFNDIRHLELKVRSAQKGYAFGCNSITQNPHLAVVCVGQENCKFFQKSTEERKKKGLLWSATFYEDKAMVYEEIWKPGEDPVFVGCSKETGEISYHPVIDCEKFSVTPYMGAELTEYAVILPEGVEEYGNLLDLVDRLKAHIHEYSDVPPLIEEYSAWYIIMSWIYDRLPTVSYLRFRGDSGTGKSRSLDVIGRLCYKPMMCGGAITPAPIYRIIRRFRGTLILDEADFSDSSEKDEVVTILNCGFERKRPVIRCNKNDPNELEILPCFGPKVFATRGAWTDKALESRCISHIMLETDREDIAPILGELHQERERILRNQLLLWRLKTMNLIDVKALQEIDLGHIEPRLKQIGLPHALAFKDFPEILAKFKVFLKEYNKELIKERATSDEGLIVLAFLRKTIERGKGEVAAKHIQACLASEFNTEMTTNKIGGKIKTLGFTDKRRRRDEEGRYCHFYTWENKKMHKLVRRYVTDPEEMESLFQVDVEV